HEQFRLIKEEKILEANYSKIIETNNQNSKEIKKDKARLELKDIYKCRSRTKRTNIYESESDKVSTSRQETCSEEFKNDLNIITI
ncbi:4838_t:CDS:2, partial [Scutellospora calospora]